MQNPCHPRCPNANIKTIGECAECGGDIYEGETMYELLDVYFCEECVNRSRKDADF